MFSQNDYCTRLRQLEPYSSKFTPVVAEEIMTHSDSSKRTYKERCYRPTRRYSLSRWIATLWFYSGRLNVLSYAPVWKASYARMLKSTYWASFIAAVIHCSNCASQTADSAGIGTVNKTPVDEPVSLCRAEIAYQKTFKKLKQPVSSLQHTDTFVGYL